MIDRPSFWSDQRVVITGHSGFKGYWLATWLNRWGAEVLGLSLPNSPPNNLRQFAGGFTNEIWSDIRDDTWSGAVMDFEPTIIFHLAAQPLVSVGYEEPLATFSTNVSGTANILECVSRTDSVQAVVVITTDKVYEPTAQQPYSETSPLGGHDPYAGSKAAAEMVVASWPKSGSQLVTARSGNVIGGGDFTAGRLVPDLVQAWSAGQPVELRSPSATRPWQHVLEPLDGYLRYAEALVRNSEVLPPSLNFGPSQHQAVSVAEFVRYAAEAWYQTFGTSKTPKFVEQPGTYLEAELLSLDSTAAQDVLHWVNRLDWREAIEWTFSWQRGHQDGVLVNDLIAGQIDDYLSLGEGQIDDCEEK